MRITWACYCGHPLSAVSEHALIHAMNAHSAHVNATADRAIDLHFAESPADLLTFDQRRFALIPKDLRALRFARPC